MAKPLGMIKDANPNVKAVDVYSLILNNVVVNSILASYNDILSISSTYDYCVDITMNGSSFYGPGTQYNASNDTFVPPPVTPIDFVESVHSDFNDVITGLLQAIADSGLSGGSLTNQQINAAYNSALNDNPGLDQSTLTLMQSVLQYVLAGG